MSRFDEKLTSAQVRVENLNCRLSLSKPEHLPRAPVLSLSKESIPLKEVYLALTTWWVEYLTSETGIHPHCGWSS